ncbi:HIS7 [Symbiodinium necroappetens]|uniref:HIS7 protein n=1 Tax=Symbiodinium necroappetens TaxID=1628268 RepID=A0A812TG49_9DINO|nr:HIS7 [Symbiodinium necroappetens]
MTVYPMTLHGLSGGDLAAIHKLRLSYQVGVSFEEQYLSPSTEMHESQGDAWLSFAARRHVNTRPLQGFGALKSFTALRSVAQSQIARVQAASQLQYEGGPKREPGVKREPQAAQVKEEGSECKESDDEDTAYASPKSKQRRVSAQPQLAIVHTPTAEKGMLATGKSEILKTRSGVGRGRGGRGGGRGAAQTALADAQEMEEAPALMDAETFQKVDPEMFQVAEMHERISGKSSVSFQNLDVLRFLQGEKLGQSLVGARRALASLNGSSEEQMLTSRISLCQAALDLSGKVDSLSTSNLVLNLKILEPVFDTFPFAMHLRVVRRLYQTRLQIILRLASPMELDDTADDANALEAMVSSLCRSFAFWDGTQSEATVMDHEAPSFYPLYVHLRKRAEALGESVACGKDEDSDEEFLQLRQGSKRKRDDEDPEKEESGSESVKDPEETDTTCQALMRDVEASRAFCGAVKKTLNDDAFLAALNHVKDDAVCKRLCLLAAGFLEEIEGSDGAEADSRTAFFEKDYVGKMLQETYQVGLRFFKCVCKLLQVPTHSILKIEDVSLYLHYKGPETFMKAIRSLLTQPEPQNENFTKTKDESRRLLQDCVSDIMRTAATESGGSAVKDTLLKRLSDVGADLTPGCCEPLQEALKQLPVLERQVRKGATGVLKDCLLKSAVSLTDEAVLRQNDVRINGQDLATLMAVLKHFRDDKGTNDRRISLQEWGTANVAVMNEQEASKLLAKFATDASQAAAMKDVAFDANYMLELLAKLPSTVQPETEKAFQAALGWLVEKALFEVMSAEAAEETTGLIVLLKKCVVLANLPQEQGATLQSVQQMLKHAVMFRSRAKTLFNFGKDAAERLKKGWQQAQRDNGSCNFHVHLEAVLEGVRVKGAEWPRGWEQQVEGARPTAHGEYALAAHA